MKTFIKNNIYILVIFLFSLGLLGVYKNNNEKKSTVELEKKLDIESRKKIAIKKTYFDSIFSEQWANNISFNDIDFNESSGVKVLYTINNYTKDDFFKLVFGRDHYKVKKMDSLIVNQQEGNNGTFTFKKTKKINDTLYVTVPVSLLTNYLAKKHNNN